LPEASLRTDFSVESHAQSPSVSRNTRQPAMPGSPLSRTPLPSMSLKTVPEIVPVVVTDAVSVLVHETTLPVAPPLSVATAK